jgi:hypothetical protein
MAARTGPPAQNSQDKTASTEQSGQDSQDIIARQDWSKRKGEPGMESTTIYGLTYFI